MIVVLELHALCVSVILLIVIVCALVSGFYVISSVKQWNNLRKRSICDLYITTVPTNCCH